jgi:hypothetical protein
MAEKHLDALLSAAYDDELDPLARRHFDTHLERCDRCARSWDEYRTALDAVRALPAVAMPATVRLPVGPPQVEAGRAALLGRLRRALLHPQPMWAATGLAVVSLVAVILAVHHPGGGTGTRSNGSVAFAPTQPAPAAPIPQPEALGAVPAPAVPGRAAVPRITPCPVSDVPASTGGGTASGFANASRADVGGRVLVLATPTDHYAPGSSVPIYARLTGRTSSAGGTDVVPCVALETEGAPRAASGGQGAGAPADAAAPATPIAVATSQPASSAPHGAAGVSSAGAAADLSVTIPANVPHGSHLTLVALIPAASSPTGAPLQIELYITVD